MKARIPKSSNAQYDFSRVIPVESTTGTAAHVEGHPAMLRTDGSESPTATLES